MSYKELPEGYIFHRKIDLKNNKKQYWLVQGLCFGTFILFIALGVVITIFGNLKPSGHEGVMWFVMLLTWSVGYLVYIVLHELTHGVFIWMFSKAKPRFGFSFSYAYCASDAYFTKKEYVVIALSPVVVWGIVFAVLNAVFPVSGWFWVIWMLQAGNIGGAAGDFFCTYQIAHCPKDVLVFDGGTDMTIYRRATDEELKSATQEEEGA